MAIPGSGRAQAPSNFFLEGLAGGNAPWNDVVKLTIDSAGNGSYSIIYPQDRRSGYATLIRNFTLSGSQLDSIYSSISGHNFFSLDTISDAGINDGDYIGLHVRAGLNERRVLAVNISVAPLDSIVRDLNAITPDTLDLHYNALDNPGAASASPEAYSTAGSTVVNDGCTILITVKLDLLGDSIDIPTALKIKHSIENKWNVGAIDGGWCPIRLRVIVGLGDVNPDHHKIKLIPGPKYYRSWVWRVASLNGSSTFGRWWIRAGDDNTAAHEVGHLIGFDDQYTDNWWRGTSTPNPGHENDLMASLSKPAAQPMTNVLDSLVRATGVTCPDYCCSQYAVSVPYSADTVGLPRGTEIDQLITVRDHVIEAATSGGIWENLDSSGSYQFVPDFGFNQFSISPSTEDSVGGRLPLHLFQTNGFVFHLDPNPWGYHPELIGNVFGGTPPLGGYILKGLGTVEGDPLYALSNQHLYLSLDNGLSWEVDSSGLGSGTIGDVVYGPNRYLYASTFNGLFVQSLDSTVWRKITTYGGPASSSRIFVDRIGRIFVSTFSGIMAQSLDTARTWGYATYPGAPFLKLSDDAYGNVYGINGTGALYRSPGGNQGWKRYDDPLNSLTVNAPIIHDVEGDSNLFAATSLGLFKSTDQGNSWLEANGSIPAQRVYGFIKLSTGRVITSTDLGVFTKDLGDWVKRYPATGYLSRLPLIRDGLGNLYTFQTTLTFPPAISIILKSTDDGTSWNPDTSTLSGTKGTLFYVDELGTQHIATTAISSQVYAMLFQRPLGGSWSPDTAGFPSTNNSSSYSMVSDGHGTLFLSGIYPTPKIFRRSILGGPWSEDTAGSAGAGPYNQMIRDKSGIIFATGFNGIYYRPASGVWAPIASAPQLAGAIAVNISVDSSGFLFGAFAHLSGSLSVGRGVYFTRDSGATWTYAGLDSMTANGLASYGDTTFVGAERGLYKVTHTLALSVRDVQRRRYQYRLPQNFPNPFNPSTVVRYGLAERSQVVLKVYNTIGQEVSILVNEIEEAGDKSVRFDARSLPSGVYFCRLEAVSTADPAVTFTSTRKMLLIR